MRFTVLSLGALAVLTCTDQVPPDGPQSTGTSVELDSVVTVGYADESNPLLVFGYGTFMLVDTTTMLHTASREAGRMVVVDLVSGAGWEIAGDAGSQGPGEFGGRQPFASESGDTIHTFVGPVYNGFSVTGELLTTTRVDARDLRRRSPVGFMGAGQVVRVQDPPRDSAGLTVHSRALEIDDPLRGVRTIIDHELPSQVLERQDHPDYVSYAPVDDYLGRVSVEARGNTLAVATTTATGRVELATYGADGHRLATVALEEHPTLLRVDAGGRIWLPSGDRSDRGEPIWTVHDRGLKELFRVAARNLIDADRQMLLTMEIDRETGLQVLHLLRIRELPARTGADATRGTSMN